MKKIVVITTTYLDKPYANGVCARQLVEALRGMGNEVNVICYYDKMVPQEDVGYIYTVDKASLNTTSECSTSIDKCISKIRHFIQPQYDEKLSNEYYLKLCECEKNGKIDAIIAIFFPIESLVALKRFKEKNSSTKAFSYELDSIGDGISTSFLQTIKNHGYNRWLADLYKSFDAVFIMKSHKSFWLSTFGASYSSKLRIVDLPLLENKAGDKADYTEKKGEKTVFVYSGRLDKRYRSPDFLLDVLQCLNGYLDYECFFYSAGDCETLIKEKTNVNKSIHQCGYIRKEELDKKLLGADYFINIGNSVSRSVPSKLITYISYGKPIIHFSSQKMDVCKEYLLEYPLALVIERDLDKEKAARDIYDFIQRTKDKSLSYQDIIKSFPMNDPKFSAGALIELI